MGYQCMTLLDSFNMRRHATFLEDCNPLYNWTLFRAHTSCLLKSI